MESGLGDEWLRIAGVKLFADGALGSRTAHLLEPYAGTRARGVAVLPPRELRDLLRRADHAGVSVSIHAIGDRANREVLDAFTALREGTAARAPGGACGTASSTCSSFTRTTSRVWRGST